MLDKADTDYWTTVGNGVRGTEKKNTDTAQHSQQVHFLHSNKDRVWGRKVCHGYQDYWIVAF